MAKILIVDDENDLRDLLAELLAADGHDVRTAHDGEDGLRCLGEGLPDAILLDLDMPILDGRGMAYRMLSHNAGQEKIPILLLSGYADVARVARELGTPYCLVKPVSPALLQQTLARVLVERTPPRPHAAGEFNESKRIADR